MLRQQMTPGVMSARPAGSTVPEGSRACAGMPLLSSRKPLHSSPSGNCVKPAADPTTAQDPTPLEQRKRSRSLFDMDQEPQRRRMMIGGSASSAVHHQHQAAEQQLPSVQSMLCCMRGVHQQLKRQDTAAAPRFGSDPPLSGTSPTGYSSPWNCGAPPTHLQQRQARHVMHCGAPSPSPWPLQAASEYLGSDDGRVTRNVRSQPLWEPHCMVEPVSSPDPDYKNKHQAMPAPSQNIQLPQPLLSSPLKAQRQQQEQHQQFPAQQQQQQQQPQQCWQTQPPAPQQRQQWRRTESPPVQQQQQQQQQQQWVQGSAAPQQWRPAPQRGAQQLPPSPQQHPQPLRPPPETPHIIRDDSFARLLLPELQARDGGGGGWCVAEAVGTLSAASPIGIDLRPDESGTEVGATDRSPAVRGRGAAAAAPAVANANDGFVIDTSLWVTVERGAKCDAEQCTLREETRRIARRRHYHALCEHRHSAGPKAGMPLHHHQLEKVRKHQSTHEVQCCRTLASALQTDADTAAALARAGAEAYRPGAWSAAATQALAALVGGGGGGGGAQWTDVARQLTAATGLRASAQQCLLHWRIAVNKGETVAASRAWSVTEDDRLVAVVSVMGVRWPAVARLLPGRDLKQCREHYTNVVLPGGKPRPWPTAPPQSATLSGGAAQPQPRQLLSGFRHPSHSSAGALPVPHYGAAKASVTVNPELQRQPPPPQQQQQRPAAFRAHHHPPPPTAAHYHFGATQLPQAATLNGMRAAVPTFDQRHFGGDVLTMVSSGSPCGGRGAQGAPMPFGSGGRGAYAAAAAPSTAAAGAPPRAFEVVASLLSLRHV